MKKLIKFLFTSVTLFLLLNGCGEPGPVGPQGPQGPPGPEVLPTSFEFEADLTQSNGFEFFRDIPTQIEVFESDVMLAYVLEDYIPEDDLEVWRQLPITDFNSRGTVQINFDYTFVDIRIFMDANYNLGSIDEYEDLLIRAVHVPAAFLNTNKAMTLSDTKTLSELEQMLGVEVQNFKM
jgi:hypothetical protein